MAEFGLPQSETLLGKTVHPYILAAIRMTGNHHGVPSLLAFSDSSQGMHVLVHWQLGSVPPPPWDPPFV